MKKVRSQNDIPSSNTPLAYLRGEKEYHKRNYKGRMSKIEKLIKELQEE
jgi:hypothetical protein